VLAKLNKEAKLNLEFSDQSYIKETSVRLKIFVLIGEKLCYLISILRKMLLIQLPLGVHQSIFTFFL